MTSPALTFPIKSHYRPGEITGLCDAAINTATAALARIAEQPPEKRTIDTTLLAFETAMADFGDATLPLTLMGYVYPDPAIAAEGSACEEKAGMFVVSVFTRRDLYDAIKDAVTRTPEESRLQKETLRQFKKNGLALPDDRLAVVRAKKEQLTKLEVEFTANLNNDTSSIGFSAAELDGVPKEALATFARTASGLYRVTTKYPDYIPVMQNAKNGGTRKRLYTAFVNRQAEANTRLLTEAITGAPGVRPGTWLWELGGLPARRPYGKEHQNRARLPLRVKGAPEGEDPARPRRAGSPQKGTGTGSRSRRTVGFGIPYRTGEKAEICTRR